MSSNQVLYARQPIVTNALEIYGYELLFRAEAPFCIIDGNYATSQVLLNAFNEGDVEEFMKGGRAFVNFTKELLIEPPPFRKEAMVIEILENIEISEEVIAAVKTLNESGFKLALDDYTPGNAQDELIPYVSIVKLEFPSIQRNALQQVIRDLKTRNVTVLAEKIETHEEFRLCSQLGCDLFQGFFISKPEIIEGRKLPQRKMAVMKLVAKLQKPGLSIEEITKTISLDPSLSVKLLQLINSVSLKRAQNIDSIHMAVILLGISRVKAWASLLALATIDDKPRILIHFALIRAHMCELISELIEPHARDTYFTIGLFSCLEAFFDQPLREILVFLPLDKKVMEALLNMKGKPGLALNTVLNYEHGNHDAIHWKLLARQNINGKVLNEVYKASILFANEHANL